MAIETTETTENNETRRAPARVAVEEYTERESQPGDLNKDESSSKRGRCGWVCRQNSVVILVSPRG